MHTKLNLPLIGTIGMGVTLAALTGCGSNYQKEKTTPPNIIFILADDLGYNELGCYGQEIIKTPNIDRIAAEGMRFTQHYSGSPVCAPSRCVLMTGKHTGHSYVRNNFEVRGKQMVRMGDWKGLRQNMFKNSLQIELYNLSDDIGKQNDISKQHPEIVEQIRKIMMEARTPSKEFPFKQIDLN